MGILIKTHFKCNNNVGKYVPITIDERLIPYAIATSLSNQDIADKLSAFVVALDNGGILGKIQAFYPMYGDTFDKMSYNLLEPDKYQLELKDNAVVSVTPDTEFIKVSEGGYISTNFTFPQDQLNDYHLLYSSGNTVFTSNELFVPIGVGAMGNGSLIILKWEDNIIFRTSLTDANMGGYNNPSMVIASIDGIIQNHTYYDYESTAPFKNTINGSYVTLGGYNTGSMQVGVELPPDELTNGLDRVVPYEYAGMGKKLTKDELLIYSEALKLLK